MAVNSVQGMAAHQVQTQKGKKVARAIAGAAVITGAALYLAKTGKLNAVEGGNEYIEKIKEYTKRPADFINSKIEEGIANLRQSETLGRKMVKAQTFLKTQAKKVEATPQFKSFQKFVKVEGKAAKEYAVKTVEQAGKYLDDALNFVESKLHPEKFL